MHILTRKPITEFGKQHPEIASALGHWFQIVKRAHYRSPHDVQQDFPKASFLGDHLTVFNIGSCRLEVDIRYDLGRVYVRSIDAHDAYDRRNKTRRKK